MFLVAQQGQKQNHLFSLPVSGLLIAILALGVFFRFANLDKKIYWLDEFITSLRISGYSAAELTQDLFHGGEVTAGDIQKYQHIRSERSLLDVIGSLVLQKREPPLYYVLARLWAELFGDSIAAIRALSAFLSVLAIASLYWLSRELFGSLRITWMAIAFTAISPFHVLYAQEARPYSLWLLMTVISCATLLATIRLGKAWSWGLYALTLVAGIQTHFFFGLVLLGHVIYLLSLKTNTFKKSSPYLAAGVAALVVYCVVGVLSGFSEGQITAGWFGATALGPLDRLKRWTVVFSSGFIDTGGVDVLKANYGFDSSWIHLIRLPVLFLIAYSFYFMYLHAPQRIWLFVLALTGATVIPLILADLTLGWQVSAHPRYLTPYYLGALLCVAYLLAVKIGSPDVSQQRIWRLVAILIVSSGIVSCAISLPAETWWNKEGSNPQIARIINQATRPVLIAAEGGSFVNAFSLIRLLAPDVRIRLIAHSNRLEIPDDSSNVFLISPTERVRQRLERTGYRIEAVNDSDLQRVKRMPKFSGN